MTAVNPAPEAFTLTTVKAEPRIDSRLLAQQMTNKHKATMALIERYADKLKDFGQLPFKKEVGDRTQGGGNPERFALLNEDQAFLLLSLSRNNERVVTLKVRLVKAFGEARRASEQRQAEYLPTYHQLHDELHALAAGRWPTDCSVHAHTVHAGRRTKRGSDRGTGRARSSRRV